MKLRKKPKVHIRVECPIPHEGHVHDLYRWFGKRSIENGKMVWRPWTNSLEEFAILAKNLQAELNIELNWREMK